MSEEFAKQVPGEGRDFTACGVSLVLHPRSPMVPTVHANFRFLTKGDRQWFGGGADLTPYYPYREDVIHFHRVWQRRLHAARPADRLRRASRSGATSISSCRTATKPRGVGGIFFDYLEGDVEGVFAFVRDCGDSFLDAYLPIARRRKDEPYTERATGVSGVPPRPLRRVQPDLRPRHAVRPEDGRPHRVDPDVAAAAWCAGATTTSPEPGTREAELYEVYLKPRDWAAEGE